MSVWYILYNGKQVGPMTKENLLAYRPNPDTMVWKEGMENWQPIYSIPELMEIVNGMPPTANVYPQPGVTPPTTPPFSYSSKDKTTAGILALLLGSLGIQYFYIGKTGAGLLTILLSAVTCGLWGFLMFIQGILMLTMSQHEFDQKYVFTTKSFPVF